MKFYLDSAKRVRLDSTTSDILLRTKHAQDAPASAE